MKKGVTARNRNVFEGCVKAVKQSRCRFFALTFSVFVILYGFVVITQAQRSKIPKEPVQIVDAATGSIIPEVLIIPRYYSASGVIMLSPKLTGAVPTVRLYLKHPFIYKTGEQFIVKKPMFFKGLPLLFVFAGQFKDIQGVLVVAKGYRPLWTDDLWGNLLDDEPRKMKLTPVSDEE